jgi:hypothetical protein
MAAECWGQLRKRGGGRQEPGEPLTIHRADKVSTALGRGAAEQGLPTTESPLGRTGQALVPALCLTVARMA